MPLSNILSAVACLMGAAGVVTAAAAGHGGNDTRWAAAAQMLLPHAAASLAILAVTPSPSKAGLLICAVCGLQGGAILFAADMAARSFGGNALFPMAAPLGGTAVILAWLLAGLGFLLRAPRP